MNESDFRFVVREGRNNTDYVPFVIDGEEKLVFTKEEVDELELVDEQKAERVNGWSGYYHNSPVGLAAGRLVAQRLRNAGHFSDNAKVRERQLRMVARAARETMRYGFSNPDINKHLLRSIRKVAVGGESANQGWDFALNGVHLEFVPEMQTKYKELYLKAKSAAA